MTKRQAVRREAPFQIQFDRTGQQAAVAGTVTVLSLVFAGILFRDEAIGAIRVWIDSPTFNHCFLVLPISLFLIWQRRATLEDVSVRPDWRAAAVVLILSAAWLIASVVGVLEARQFVVMTIVEASLFGILGAAFYRKLLAPFLYLYFLVPTGAFLIPALQAFTAKFSVAGLHLLGIPVFSNGAVIEIPAGTFAIAEACAGLRFLIAAVAFGVFFALITYRSWIRRTIFIVLSAIVPVIANGFRALGLIAVAEWIGNPTAALADHVIYGWIFFSLVLMLLVFIGQCFSDWHDSHSARPGTLRTMPLNSIASWRTGVVAVTCFLAAAASPVAASFLESFHPTVMPERAPSVGPPWRKLQSPPEWRPIMVGSSQSFSESFVDGPHRVDRFIALYSARGRGSNLLRSSNRDADERAWSFDSARHGLLRVDGHLIPVQVSRWVNGTQHRTVWSFYVVGGRFTADALSVKWAQFRAYLTGNACPSAYVALSSVEPEDEESVSAVGALFGSTEPLGPYLCRSTTARARP
jgi:exosortase A